MSSSNEKHSDSAMTGDGTSGAELQAAKSEESPSGYDDLPIYIGPEEIARSEHSISLRDGDNTWLTLKVKSSAAAATSHPLFFDGASMDGSVQMVLRSAQSIHSVTLLFEGRSRTARDYADAKIFLSMSMTLYHPEVSGSKLPPGSYEWPFSFQLPRKVEVEVEGKHHTTALASSYKSAVEPQKVFGGMPGTSLPANFTAASLAASVQYELHLTVHRGALHHDHHLTTEVVVLPRSRPAPASYLRQLAYTNGTDLIGPQGDPNGWHAISKAIRGTVFSKLNVEILCTLHLAKPLVYARETAIPFVITFESRDTQAADLLYRPASVKVHLEQSVAVRDQPAMTSVVGIGRCFIGQTQGRRRLEGEIPVGRDLKPGFSVGLRLSYAVTLSIAAAGFALAGGQGHGPIMSQDVGIATDLPQGPRQYLVVPADDETVPRYDDNADRTTLVFAAPLMRMDGEPL